MAHPIIAEFPRRIVNYARWSRARISTRGRLSADASTVTLPFNLKPIATAYVYNAYSLGILTAHEPPHRFHAACLQLYFPKAKLTNSPTAKFECFPPLGVWQYVQLGHLGATVWNSRTPESLTAQQLVGRLLAALAQKRYLYVFCDEFFLPGSLPYLRYNHRHERLIYGYDAPSDSFLMAGYRRTGEYGSTFVPAALTASAILSADGRKRGSYNDSDTVVELAAIMPQMPEPEPTTFAHRCLAYLSGADSEAAAIRQLVKPASENYSKNLEGRDWSDGGFGIKAYPLLRRYFEEAGERGHELDVRLTRVLWEHKLLVREIAGDLDRRYGLGLSAVVGAECEALVSAARKLHHLTFAAAHARTPQAIDVPAVLKLLEALEAGDRSVFQGIVRSAERFRGGKR